MSKPNSNTFIDHTLPKKACVGIITVPLSPDKKYYKVCGDSYISTSHIHMLKRVGLGVIAIPYDTDRFDYYMERINGLYFPSGGVFASNNIEYYNCCKKFYELALKANDADRHFPIWGACMGMQQMLMIADSRDNLELLEEFDSFGNLMSTLQFPTDPRETQLFRNAPADFLLRLQREECTLNNHKMGLSVKSFRANPRISEFFRIVSSSVDRLGQEYVSTIEAYKYPFYGFQWHPERNNEMDYLVSVFAADASMDDRSHTVANIVKLPYRKVHCMNYSGNIYKYCNFYWHDRTSFHNAKLCSILNLGEPVGSGI
jgi:gamma-glutamyl hydrolase